MRLLSLISAAFLCTQVVHAQNYTATNGSSYTGSLHVHNNPASIVNSPVKWDISLFGIQEKHTTNMIRIDKYSKSDGMEASFPGGTYKRYADLNFNLNLLNARIALNRRSAFAFGANLKSYSTLQLSASFLSDTLGSFSRFFELNEGTSLLKYNFSTANWAEVYLAYGQTILDDETRRLNAGVTLKVNKGLGGAFASLDNVHFTRTNSTSPPAYRLTNADLDYGYSSNYDAWDDDKSVNQNVSNFIGDTKYAGSVDIGLEYMIKLPSIPSVFDDASHYDYDWKIGLSILDIGFSQYQFGKYSTRARNLRPNVTDDTLDQVFDASITSLSELRDTVSRLYAPIGTYTGLFGIGHPTRVVLNIDKFITGAFFVNADISVSLSSLSKRINMPARDLNLLTLTGRWETKKTGVYLPISFNNRNQVWVGGAARVGPVLLGLHNWGNLLSKKKLEHGGFYLAFILKASDYTGTRSDKRLNCPQ